MPGVTEINSAYLTTLQQQLQQLLTEIETQLDGMGTTGTGPDTTNFIKPVDSTLAVIAGPSSSGSTTFPAGGALNAALSSMGGSVHDKLVWLKNVVSDMISELTTVISKFNGTESLNSETVDQLAADFRATIGDEGAPSSSSSSST